MEKKFFCITCPPFYQRRCADELNFMSDHGVAPKGCPIQNQVKWQEENDRRGNEALGQFLQIVRGVVNKK